ncbi:MAG: dihydroorotate dehydrogenase electron transfer subunit [Candidatus Caldatribacteriota bacterium]|nr:dihydroorotate dehydrogenase electron transfer subunit [Candidatus Caldatribacteriota bacterium]
MRLILKTKVKIFLKEKVAPDIYLMGLSASLIANEAKPGQFIHIKCNTNDNPLLRRPISIHKIDKDKGEIFILFQVKGKGTKILSERETGEYLDVIGPIGNGFQLFSKSQKIMIIGGGMGIAPLLTIAEESVLKGKEVKVLIGAANQKMILGEKHFKKLGVETCIATEDGSCQYKGLVTDLIEKIFLEWQPDQIFACGPKPMSRKIAQITENRNIDCQVSLEEKMGCGIGACLGCVCKIKTKETDNFKGNQNQTNYIYKRVCVDGPVFEVREVVWDD